MVVMRQLQLLLTLFAVTTYADTKPGRPQKESTKKEPHADEKTPIPAQCLRDINPTGRYQLKLTAVPSMEIAIRQCSETGKSVVIVYDIEADPDSNFIRVKNPTSRSSIIRDPRLQRSVTDYCKSKGATRPVVTWFSWDEYIPLKDGWSITYKGFGSGDAENASVAQKISLTGMMMDANNMPVCYFNWDSE